MSIQCPACQRAAYEAAHPKPGEAYGRRQAETVVRVVEAQNRRSARAEAEVIVSAQQKAPSR